MMNMKNKIKMIAVMLLVVLTLASCTVKNTNVDNDEQQNDIDIIKKETIAPNPFTIKILPKN